MAQEQNQRRSTAGSWNKSSDERNMSFDLASSSSFSNPSQDSIRRSLLATSRFQRPERRKDNDDCSLPNESSHQQNQQRHSKGGPYDHLPLARLLQQYQQQQEQQQKQKQQQQHLQQVALTLSPEKDGTLPHSSNTMALSSKTATTTTTSIEAASAAAEAEEYFPGPCDLLEVSTNPRVDDISPSVWTADAATRTAATMPNGIAGTARPSLFESGQKPQPPLQCQTYQNQHSQQAHSTAFSQLRSFAAPRSSHPAMISSPFSFHNNNFSTFERNKAITERALHLMQLVLDTIPLLQKMEYAVALRMVPQLVQLESSPTRFLRYTNWDAHAAAHKLVAYWKRRVALFGQDRAYLPLTLWTLSAENSSTSCHSATESALSKEDVVLIQAGFIAYAAHPPFQAELSVQNSDSIETVVVIDESRRSSDAAEVRLRASFYHAHCIAENPLSQTEGFVGLCIVQSPEYYDHHTMECLSMILDTFPVRLKAWHTFDCSSMSFPSLSASSPSPSSALLRQGYLFAYFEIFLDLLNEYTTYHYSVGEHSCLPLSSAPSSSSPSTSASRSTTTTAKMYTPDEIRWELETEHEFTAEEIPTLLGGCWTYDAFQAWFRERMHLERRRYYYKIDDGGDVGTWQGNQDNDSGGGLFGGPVTGVAYDTGRHDRPHRFGMGRSSKRSKRYQQSPQPMYEGDVQEKKEEGKDATSRANDMKQVSYKERRHIIDGDQQREFIQESEQDGSLEDLMKKFQQLMFSESPSSAALPKDSQKQTLTQPNTAHASGPIPSFNSRVFEHQQPEDQRVAIGTYSMSSTSAVSPLLSRMNLLHPLALLEKAIDAIPINNKVELMTALQVAPRLVAHESDPIRFLLYHDCDAQRAAEGLAYYWKTRHEWFGDRAYLPMTVYSLGSGAPNENGNDGALTTEDICLLRSGFMVIVGTDRQGSPVLIMDSSRRNTTSTSARFRATFYVFQLLSEYRTSQMQGAVVFNIMQSNNLDKVSTKSMQMVMKTFPTKFKAVHSIDCMEKNNLFYRGFVQGMLGIIARFFSLTKVHFYTSQSQQERERNVKILEEEHGLIRDLLPCNIGGTWVYERVDEWLMQRTHEEKQLLPFDVHMHDRSLGIASNSINYVPYSAPDPTTWNQPLGTASRSLPIPQEFMIDDGIGYSTSTDGIAYSTSTELHKIPENVQSLDKDMTHLSVQETKAFKDALQRAKPQIWEEECNPELFLRVEQLDTRKAAERMAKYWQLRSQTFGQKQYDLLTQTGEDALGQTDRKALATGFLTLLPTDTNGQSILFVDLSRLDSNIGSRDRHRCLFYMMSLMTENEKSQTDGVILLHWALPPDFSLIDVSFLEALIKVLPLKLCRIHLISCENIPVDSVLSRVRCGGEVYIHSGTKETLCSELELFGMKKAALPKIVNGDWGYEKFVQWQELRTRVEWKVPAGLSGRDSTHMASFPAMKPYTVLEDEKERQRRLSLIHFRRRQSRNRLEIAMLQEHRTELEKEQKMLREENRELEKQYATASAIINSESQMMA